MTDNDEPKVIIVGGTNAAGTEETAGTGGAVKIIGGCGENATIGTIKLRCKECGTTTLMHEQPDGALICSACSTESGMEVFRWRKTPDAGESLIVRKRGAG
jgi:hypothetical protein